MCTLQYFPHKYFQQLSTYDIIIKESGNFEISLMTIIERNIFNYEKNNDFFDSMFNTAFI